MDFDRDGLQVLSRGEALDLLRQTSICRVGISIAALPAVLPVEFELVADQIVIQATRGSDLDIGTKNKVVAFEADSLQSGNPGGWSVMVCGFARDAGDVVKLAARARPSWSKTSAMDTVRLIAISTDIVSGRGMWPALRTTPG